MTPLPHVVGPCRVRESELVKLAGRLANTAPPVALIPLNGPLGAGKTTFVRAFLRALGVTGPVRSPTYTLMEPYEITARSGGPDRVMHLDLYRLGGGEELEYLGLREELTHSLVMVEWPERAEGALPRADLQIDLEYAGGNGDDGRELTLSALSKVGADWLRQADIDEIPFKSS